MCAHTVGANAVRYARGGFQGDCDGTAVALLPGGHAFVAAALQLRQEVQLRGAHGSGAGNLDAAGAERHGVRAHYHKLDGRPVSEQADRGGGSICRVHRKNLTHRPA